MEKDKKVLEEMEAISNMLDTAIDYGLEVEVIYWTLKYVKDNPTVSPAEAFALGVAEWVK